MKKPGSVPLRYPASFSISLLLSYPKTPFREYGQNARVRVKCKRKSTLSLPCRLDRGFPDADPCRKKRTGSLPLLPAPSFNLDCYPYQNCVTGVILSGFALMAMKKCAAAGILISFYTSVTNTPRPSPRKGSLVVIRRALCIVKGWEVNASARSAGSQQWCT